MDAVRICAGPDKHGGIGLFTQEDIDANVVVTHYFGPVRYPSLDKKTSRTHSVHILGDESVPVSQREYRVIDGYWAHDAVAEIGSMDEMCKLEHDIASIVGSLINSSRKTEFEPNVHMDNTNRDPKSVFAHETLDHSVASPFLTDEQRNETILTDTKRPWVKLSMVTTRRIAEGDELLWSYPFRQI